MWEKLVIYETNAVKFMKHKYEYFTILFSLEKNLKSKKGMEYGNFGH
jgi:hypothetical protein